MYNFICLNYKNTHHHGRKETITECVANRVHVVVHKLKKSQDLGLVQFVTLKSHYVSPRHHTRLYHNLRLLHSFIN